MTKMKISTVLKWSIWFLAALFYFYEYILRVSPGVMVPELMKSFTITASSVGVLSAFYLYAYAPMQLPVGILMDRYGVRRVLSLACIVCGLGAFLFAFAHYFMVAALGRLLIGAASAFAFISMVYVTFHWFPKERRAFLIGLANSIAMLGAAAGTGPLAVVIKNYGWRETIAGLGIFGIFLGIVIYFVCKKDKRDEKIEKETARVKSHIFENIKIVISSKSSWINGIVTLLLYMTTTAFAGLWGLPFLETAYGLGKEEAGFAIAIFFAGWFVGGPLTGLWSDFVGKRTSAIRLGILGALLSLIPVIYFPTMPIQVLYTLLFLIGLFSSAELLNFSLAIELTSPNAKATAVAFTNFLVAFGGAIIQPLIGFLLDWQWGGAMYQGIRVYDVLDYQIALTSLPITLVLAYFLLLFIKEKKMTA